MINVAVTRSAKREFLMGVHQPEDIYKIALYTGKAKLDWLTQKYSPEHEVKGLGYKAGGQILQGYVCDEDGMGAFMGWSKDPHWQVATIRASQALIYNASRGNAAILAINFGEEISSTNGPFVIPMTPCCMSNAPVRLL